MSSGYKFRFVALLLFVKLTETCSIYEILILNLELFCCGIWPRADACMLGTPILLGSLTLKKGALCATTPIAASLLLCHHLQNKQKLYVRIRTQAALGSPEKNYLLLNRNNYDLTKHRGPLTCICIF
jgi:hypothetical protein